MPLFLMQTRVSSNALHQPKSQRTLERHVADRIAEHCPEVKWIPSYAVLGPCDYIDVFEAPDNAATTQVSVLVRTTGARIRKCGRLSSGPHSSNCWRTCQGCRPHPCRDDAVGCLGSARGESMSHPPLARLLQQQQHRCEGHDERPRPRRQRCGAE